MHESRLKGKSHVIPKRLVWDAWLKVKRKGGAAGADGVTIEQFEEDLSGNLYRLWNRMSSGSYFPGPVRAVEIPKKGKKGGIRVLGIPNVVDRVAQTAAAMALEPSVEPMFHEDSYGYRPGRAPGDAVTVCRQRCFRRDWVVDLDIRSFFDSVPWKLMLRAVARHSDQKWVVLYVERWLKAPMQRPDGTLAPEGQGHASGQPDLPMPRQLVPALWARCVDGRGVPERPVRALCGRCGDPLCERAQARMVRDAVARRLVEVGLELHPDKTRIVYCKDSNRRGNYEEISFTFCGYTFRPRKAYNKRTGKTFTGFLPAVAPEKLALMSRRVAGWRLHRRTTLDLEDLAAGVNLVLRGWFGYFTAFHANAVIPLCQRIDRHLVRWARWKYKRLERSGRRAWAWLAGVRSRNPEMFVHWRYCSAPS